VDGSECSHKAENVLGPLSFASGRRAEHHVCLPVGTGRDGFNGHRIYGAFSYLVDGDYLIWLDDDNSLEPNHISSLVDLVENENLDWAYSLRRIIDKSGEFVCYDDCESLGIWKSVLKDYFIDLNCFFVKRELAVKLSPVWYRKARQPGVVEVDRAISSILMDKRNQLAFECTREYSLNYMVGSTKISVQKEFFLRGNQVMLASYAGQLPWRLKRRDNFER